MFVENVQYRDGTSVFRLAAIIAVLLMGYGCICAQDIVSNRSPIAEPYRYLSGGSFRGKIITDSPDPLVNYVWNNPKVTDPLQIYVVHPVSAVATSGEDCFSGLETISRDECAIHVRGKGVIRMDFGVELPAWIELDSPDLNGDIQMGVSEYNQPEMMNKVATPKRYGTTYRLELNKELYEGVRYGYIYVNNFDHEFTITSVRAVCQSKPTNYTGSFECDNSLINNIWYVGAYDVRANQRADCFGAILKDRGDRISWTGDAYPAQAASLVAFSNYDEVLKNLHWTESHPHGIETYELYWVESLIDYYMYSGDEKGFRELLPNAMRRLDHARDIFDQPTNLAFIGWDQRLGEGFDNPNCEEGKWTYRMLAIGAWKHTARILRLLGEDEQATQLEKLAADKTASVLKNVQQGALGMHSSADAINADLIPQLNKLYHPDLSNRENRLSYSPFNQCFLLKAMGHAGHYGDAFASVLDQWGGQIRYGGTCFFEVFRPDWEKTVGHNGPVPYSQAGLTSLAHPWGAGVVQWLSEEMLGIRPLTPGFQTFCIKPHLQGAATRISGQVNTPHGTIRASFDLTTGYHSITVPSGTECTLAIPKEGMHIISVTMNGTRIQPSSQDQDFLYVKSLKTGDYQFVVDYQGQPTQMKQEGECVFNKAKVIDVDRDTHGEWYRKYGKDGYYIVCGQEDGEDLQKLPDYVESVRFNYGENRDPHGARSHEIKALDPQATIPVSPDEGARRVLGCYYTSGCQLGPLDIQLKKDRTYRVAVYFADCDKGGRDLVVEAFDLKTLNRILPCTRIADLNGGVYMVFEFHSSVRIQASAVRGDNSVFNAVYFE